MISEPAATKVGTVLLMLFSFTIFVAKAPLNISSGLLFLATVYYLFRFGFDRLTTRTQYVWILLLPVAVGFFLSLFSFDGIKGAPNFFRGYRFLLLVIPFALFVRDRKTLERLFLVMNAAAFFDIAYCLITSDLSNLFQHFFGLHKFGRNAAMLFSLALFNTVWLIMDRQVESLKDRPLLKAALALNTALMYLSVAFLGERGAWLGCFVGLFVFFLIVSRRLLAVLVVVTLLSPIFLPESGVDRLRSIVDPHHFSNAIRIRLYTAGFDYLVERQGLIRGTGVDNVENEMLAYLESKPESYQAVYMETYRTHPGSFHNSYLQMAVEGGVLFLLAYLASLGWILWKLACGYRASRGWDRMVIMAALTVSAGFMLSQFFHEELVRYGGLVFSLSLYAGCYVNNEPEDAG